MTDTPEFVNAGAGSGHREIAISNGRYVAVVSSGSYHINANACDEFEACLAGACVPIPPPECDRDDDCGPGAICEFGFCQPDPGCSNDADCMGWCVSDTCYDGSEGDPCVGDSDCQDYCEDSICYDGSSGDPCTFNGDCQSGTCPSQTDVCD